MGRFLGIDYGNKRTGLAVTDPSAMIASPLGTIATKDLYKFIGEYSAKEELEGIVMGDPKRLNNTPTHATPFVQAVVKQIMEKFPAIPVFLVDERFTSKIAMDALIRSGVKKKERQNKELLDSTSAVIILQSFLESRSFRKERE